MTEQQHGQEALIHIDPPLPCGLSGCGHPAHLATIESDPTYPGLWHFLPICDRCRSLLNQENGQRTDAQVSLRLFEKRGL